MHHMIQCVSDVVDLIVLRQALNNPKSSMELNNWMDEKMDNRMEAFTSVNNILRNMLDKAESKTLTLGEMHTKAVLEKQDLLLQLKNAEVKHENQLKIAEIKLKDAELKHEKEINMYKLELEKSKHLIERAQWEATRAPK